MPRSTKAILQQRIDAVYDLLLQGVARRGILTYAAKQGWGVSPRQIDTYLSRAREELACQAEHDRAVELGRASEQLNLLFMKALAGGDLATARAVRRDLTDLLGLAPAARHELSGRDGQPLLAASAEAAAQVRALIEAKAARLAESGEEASCAPCPISR